MSQVNVIPVDLLTTEDMWDEYNHILLVFRKLKKAIQRGKRSKTIIPRRYDGSDKFFFDKVHYLEYRIRELHSAIALRGGDPSWKKLSLILDDNVQNIDGNFRGQYKPTHRDTYFNMALLVQQTKFRNVRRALR